MDSSANADFNPTDWEMDGDQLLFDSQQNGQIAKSDQHLLEELRERVAKVETELEKTLHEKLKHQELIDELEKKMTKMEQKRKEENEALLDQINLLQNGNKSLLDKVDKLEGEEVNAKKISKGKKRRADAFDLIEKSNEKVAQWIKDSAEFLNEKIAEMESKVPKLENDLHKKVAKLELATKVELENNNQQNCWDASFCHADLTIFGTSVGRRKSRMRSTCRNVFAKFSISSAAFSSGICYFEITGKQIRGSCTKFGFALKQNAPLDKCLRLDFAGNYSYPSHGTVCINGLTSKRNEKFGADDTVGCGVILDTKRIFFTKNGRRIDSADHFSIHPDHNVDELFPFASLLCIEDKIEANFGPKFVFDLSSLSLC